MAKNATQQWIVYVERNKIFIYHPSLKTVVEIPIPETAIKDLEIKKIGEVEKLLSAPLIANKISTNDRAIIIIGDSAEILEKIPNTSKQNAKEQIDEATKKAPFNHVAWTTVQAGKDVVVVLVNRELYEGVQEILERLGHRVVAVAPAVCLGGSWGAFSNQTAKEMLKREAVIRQNSFIVDPDQVVQEENNASSDPRKNKKLLLLLVVLVGMVLILGAVVAKSYLFPEEKPKPAPVPGVNQVESKASPTSLPSPSPVASASANLEVVKIQVLNATGQQGLAENSRQALLDAGFREVETGNSELINSPRIQIVFSPSLANEIREQIVATIAKNYPNPATREEAGGAYDAVVTLTSQN